MTTLPVTANTGLLGRLGSHSGAGSRQVLGEFAPPTPRRRRDPGAVCAAREAARQQCGAERDPRPDSPELGRPTLHSEAGRGARSPPTAGEQETGFLGKRTAPVRACVRVESSRARCDSRHATRLQGGGDAPDHSSGARGAQARVCGAPPCAQCQHERGDSGENTLPVCQGLAPKPVSPKTDHHANQRPRPTHKATPSLGDPAVQPRSIGGRGEGRGLGWGCGGGGAERARLGARTPGGTAQFAVSSAADTAPSAAAPDSAGPRAFREARSQRGLASPRDGPARL